MATSDGDLAASAIVPRELIIHLTLQCPLRCAHCCVNSDMSKKGHLDLECVLRLIEEASHIQTIERVDFVGGDPFLHQDILHAAFKYASQRDLKTAVVTSAYWATSKEKALKVLKPLAEAGLGRITLSYDDPHAEFVPEEKIVWAFSAAQELALETFVAVAVEPGARITKSYMEELLNDSRRGAARVHIYET
ncbi:MAG: radical SAM protein, partial [Acidobacteriota bacterium]|nr:radical SAM protein [Acidobacteriota bacterium]